MKVAFFMPSLHGGGAERMFVRNASYLASRGHEVDLVLLNMGAMRYLDELSEAVRMIDLEVPRLWTGLPAFRRYLLRRRPHVVISAMPLANGIAAWARKLVGPSFSLILTERNAVSMAFGDLDVPRYRPLMWAIRASYRFADALVGISSGVADRLRQVPGVASRKVHVIRNPAWRPELAELAREPIEHPWLSGSDIPVLIAIGRLEKQKDFATLLRAFAGVRRLRPARLVLLGEGSLRPLLQQLAEELGVVDDLSMPGFVSNPFAYLSRASVFVLSSTHEGFGNVLVEAMACGTPVVSTDCPSGPSEVLEAGRYGPLVPVGDAEALAAAIAAQLDHPTPSDQLRTRSSAFTIEASGDAYLKLIEELRPSK